MIRYKKGQNARLPVILKDTVGAAKTAVAASSLNIDVIKADGTVFSPVPSASLWTELTSTAYAAQGYYNYVLSGSVMDLTGVFQYCFIVTGSVPYFGVIEIVENTEKDVMDRLGVPTYGTIAADIGNVGVTAGSGGFTSGDRAMLSATYYTASLLPADPASNSHIDAQLSLSFWTNDRLNLGAIKTKTDNLPVDPASSASVLNSMNYVNSQATTNVTTINNNTNTRITEIKGASWGGSIDTLRQIGVYTNFLYASAALSATVTAARDYLAGGGFTPGTDDLHSLSIQIQGITPGSGGGGFSSADRAALYSAYTSTLPLPADPASQSVLSGVMSATRAQIMGGSPFTGTAAWGRTIKEVYDYNVTYLPTIYTYATRLPADPASNTQVVSARDYLAGAGWVAASDSLHAISAQIQSQSYSASFTPSDRAYLTQTLSGVNKVDNTTTIIKQKTDLLPNDVVSSATIFPLLYEISSSTSVSGGFSNTDRTNIENIKAKTDNLPAQPADATVTFGASDRSNLNIVYSKTNNLPIDPASITYVTQVSQSLANAILASQGVLSGAISSSYHNLSGSITGSDNTILARLGTPALASVSADIATVNTLAGNAATAAGAADASAQTAATQATTAAVAAAATNVLLGTPMSGTVSADISATYNAALAGSSSFSGTISASVDFRPILNILGTPIKTIADDIYQTALLVKTVAPKK